MVGAAFFKSGRAIVSRARPSFRHYMINVGLFVLTSCTGVCGVFPPLCGRSCTLTRPLTMAMRKSKALVLKGQRAVSPNSRPLL